MFEPNFFLGNYISNSNFFWKMCGWRFGKSFWFTGTIILLKRMYNCYWPKKKCVNKIPTSSPLRGHHQHIKHPVRKQKLLEEKINFLRMWPFSDVGMIPFYKHRIFFFLIELLISFSNNSICANYSSNWEILTELSHMKLSTCLNHFKLRYTIFLGGKVKLIGGGVQSLGHNDDLGLAFDLSVFRQRLWLIH